MTATKSVSSSSSPRQNEGRRLNFCKCYPCRALKHRRDGCSTGVLVIGRTTLTQILKLRCGPIDNERRPNEGVSLRSDPQEIKYWHASIIRFA